MPDRPDTPDPDGQQPADAGLPLLRAAVARLAPVLPMLTELGERFAGSGHDLALVGGPVRDAFLGRVSPDLDLTSDARPDEILAVVRGWADAHWDIGREFGTIGLRKGAARHRDHDLPRRHLRPHVAQARGHVRRQPRG